MEATLRIELRIRVLQTRALPLGYVAIKIDKANGKLFTCRSLLFMERETRFELAASALARQRSTTEPFPHKIKLLTPHLCAVRVKIGGDYRARTYDRLLVRQMLSQLS